MTNASEITNNLTEEYAEQAAADEKKIYCANCIHCKLAPAPADTVGQFYLRVRCAAGKWKKKLGEEKLYKYCTVMRRCLDACDAYEAMGSTQDFLKDLRKSLPVYDELYTEQYETF